MIGCDACKELAVPVFRIGEQDFAWCGRTECLSKILVKARETIEPLGKRIKAALFEFEGGKNE